MAFWRRKKGSEEAAPPVETSASSTDLEAEISTLGEAFLELARKGQGGLLSGQFWSDKLMDWAMKDEAFKIQLFRFVDAFPTLKTNEEIYDHLVDYMQQPGVTPPPGLNLGLKAGGTMKGVVAKTMSSRIRGMAEQFIAGEDAQGALPKLRKTWKKGYAFSVDLLGEACVSDVEAAMYQQKYLALVRDLPDLVEGWKPNPTLDSDHLGPIPRANVSIKISSLYAKSDPIDSEASILGLMKSIVPILELAREKGVLINFDMEHYALKDLTIALFKRCCEAVDFHAGIAIQAYLRSGDDDARDLIAWSQKTGRQVTVRLVKGAYWDQETIVAEMEGWPVPVWSRKIETDACFERMATMFIDATPRTKEEGGIKLALGSHNVRSIAAALAHLKKVGLPESAIELQMLYGMADPLKKAAAKQGLRLREYFPVGEMIPGMGYFVRRLLENSSNESWLRASALSGASAADLLKSPHESFESDPGVERISGAPERHELSPKGTLRPFFTEPMRDFADVDQREAFAAALSKATVPVVENGSTVDDAAEAVGRAQAAFVGWRDTDPQERAAILVRAAALMRERRDELSGIIILENGKDWRNADADVCEAIDFCEYYARLAPPLFAPQRLGRFVGELNQTLHQPRGVAAIISPWNFPLAICAGMTTAALVTGNTAIVKPAEQTPAIARILCEILWQAGVPHDVLQCLPGPGETVGAALVRDPRVSLIAFTGSKAVGLDIIAAAGQGFEQQTFVKRVVCEMGGKNAIIVDTSADLDEAVIGVRNSAFGFQGQKCSACSRVIVTASAHDRFLARLIASTQTMVIGDPRLPGTDIGPVIDEEAATKIRRYIEIGKTEGKLEVGLQVPEGLADRVGKPFVGPHIFSGIRPEHRLAQEEIFGPVLAVMRVEDFDEALKVANGTPYKLTGAVYSRMPSHLERARYEFRVGNLYLNRGSTGALVGRQPFGGFGMSGIGAKAGGAAYLQQFVSARLVCENTLRRGFAPGLNDG